MFPCRDGANEVQAGLPIVSVYNRLERADEFCHLLSPLWFRTAAAVEG